MAIERPKPCPSWVWPTIATFLFFVTSGLTAATIVGFSSSDEVELDGINVTTTAGEAPLFEHSSLFVIDAERRARGVQDALARGEAREDDVTYTYFAASDANVLRRAARQGCHLFAVVPAAFADALESESRDEDSGGETVLEIDSASKAGFVRLGRIRKNVPQYTTEPLPLEDVTAATSNFVSACGAPRPRAKSNALVVHAGGGLKALTTAHAVFSKLLPVATEEEKHVVGTSGGGWAIQMYRALGHYATDTELAEEIASLGKRIGALDDPFDASLLDDVREGLGPELRAYLDTLVKTGGSWKTFNEVLLSHWSATSLHSFERATISTLVPWASPAGDVVVEPSPFAGSRSPQGWFYPSRSANLPVHFSIADGQRAWRTAIRDSEARLPDFSLQRGAKAGSKTRVASQQLTLGLVDAMTATSAAAAAVLMTPSEGKVPYPTSVYDAARSLEKNGVVELALDVDVGDAVLTLVDGGFHDNIPVRTGLVANYLPHEPPPDTIYVAFPGLCTQRDAPIADVYLKYAIETPAQECDSDCFDTEYPSQAFLASVESSTKVYDGGARCDAVHVHIVRATLARSLPEHLRLKPVTLYVIVTHVDPAQVGLLNFYNASVYSSMHRSIATQMDEFLNGTAP